MRIRNPPTFIMSTSLIMSLIMTLLVFQCSRAYSADHALCISASLQGRVDRHAIGAFID